MTVLKISNELSWSNIIQGIVIIASIVFGYSYIKTTGDSNTTNISANSSAILALDARVRNVELSSNRQSAEFAALKETLNEIKEQQRDNNTMLRQLIQSIAAK